MQGDKIALVTAELGEGLIAIKLWELFSGD